MSNLTPDELARLRLKAKHGMLTPEEQQARCFVAALGCCTA